MISQTVLDYNQIVWIRLAHRLYSDFQYFFFGRRPLSFPSWLSCSLKQANQEDEKDGWVKVDREMEEGEVDCCKTS